MPYNFNDRDRVRETFHDGRTRDGTVVSAFEDAITVSYDDGGSEVIGQAEAAERFDKIPTAS
jgi:hypothetical protein